MLVSVWKMMQRCPGCKAQPCRPDKRMLSTYCFCLRYTTLGYSGLCFSLRSPPARQLVGLAGTALRFPDVNLTAVLCCHWCHQQDLRQCQHIIRTFLKMPSCCLQEFVGGMSAFRDGFGEEPLVNAPMQDHDPSNQFLPSLLPDQLHNVDPSTFTATHPWSASSPTPGGCSPSSDPMRPANGHEVQAPTPDAKAEDNDIMQILLSSISGADHDDCLLPTAYQGCQANGRDFPYLALQPAKINTTTPGASILHKPEL